MVHKCSVPMCRGNYKNGPQVSAFSFPKDDLLKRKWISAIKRQDFVPTKHSRVCEAHFREADIERETFVYHSTTGEKLTCRLRTPRLTKDAVPSVFTGYPAYLAVPELDKKSPAKKRNRKENAQLQRAIKKRKKTKGNENDTRGNRSMENDSESSSSDERCKQQQLQQQAGSSTSQQDPPLVIKTEPLDAEPFPDDPPIVPGVLEASSTTTQYVIEGKRFVNVGYLIRSLQKLNDHGGANCNFSDMTICGETKDGWNIGVELSCRVCFTSAVVWMEDPEAKLVPTRVVQGVANTRTQPATFSAKVRKSKQPRKTPTPPPDDPLPTTFLMPLPRTNPVFVPLPKEVPKVTTMNQSHLKDLPVIRMPQNTSFINQKVVYGSSMSRGASSSTIKVPQSSTVNPANVQLLFFVDQPASSQVISIPSTVSSSVENITVTPDIFVGGQKYSATSQGTSTTSENITVTPDIPVLPVDLNLVKKEVEDTPEPLGDGRQSMDVNDKPGVCLVPMSETSLDPSQSLFASDGPKTPSHLEIPKASSSTSDIKISSVKSCTKTSATKTSTALSETTGSNVPTENPTATSRLKGLKYQKLITKENAKSFIWKYFGLPADENGRVVDNSISVCRICKIQMKYLQHRGTSSMFRHLKILHPLKYKYYMLNMPKRVRRKYSSVRKVEALGSRKDTSGGPSNAKRALENEVSSTSIEDVGNSNEPPGSAISPIENTKAVSLSTRPVDSENSKSSEFLSNAKIPKSEIWNHFSLPTGDRKIVVCNICTKYVVYKNDNTVYMFNHLKWHHPSIRNSLYCQPLDSYSNNCIESITKFLVFTLQPYNLVEMKSFINMIRNINPSYKMPSRKYFTKIGIPKLYNEAMEQLKQETSIANGKEITMSVDCWTSVANTPYITVTIHFIDNQWNLKSACINCTRFQVNDTYTNLSNTLTNALSNWGLDVANVTYCTADNGSNILKALSHINLTHISCFGHNLNIGINRALGISCLENSVSKLKQLQSVISQNSEMTLDLAKAQEILQMEIVSLPVACPTRWRSTLKLIRRFLSNQLPIEKMLEGYPDQKHLLPDTREVSALEDFVASTKLLEDVTTTLTGEQYISASSIWPLYRKIQKNLQCQDADNELTRQIKSIVSSSLSERYEEESLKTILWMSSLCDPRFRLNFTDNAHDIKTIALQQMTRVYKNIDTPTIIYIQPDSRKKGLEKLFDFEDDSSDNDSFNYNNAQAELNKYLSMPRVNLNVDPFAWWKSNENSFPALKTIARKYLAIQGSSVPADRVFSTRGDVITRQRAALLPKHAEMQIFLAENQKSVFK